VVAPKVGATTTKAGCLPNALTRALSLFLDLIPQGILILNFYFSFF